MTTDRYLRGELCLQSVSARSQATARSSDKATATDSAAVMSAAPVSEIAAELRRIRTAHRRGAHATARRHLDRLIDFVWLSGPETAA